MLRSSQSPPIDELHPAIQRAIQNIPHSSHYIIALSGGLDSVALLYFSLSYLRGTGAKIEAVHVHHGLNEAADEWAGHCESLCSELNVPIRVERVSISNQGKGIEAAARDTRYQVFERYIHDDSILLLGHHMNDQAETVLMRMIRGAGPEGLSAIPQQRVLSRGQLYRPWLRLRRSILHDGLVERGVKWVEDESNASYDFDRNFIRHEILPLIEGRWGDCVGDLCRVADRSRESQAFIDSWCESQLPLVTSVQYANEQALCLNQLGQYSQSEQRVLMSYWFDRLRVAHPPDKVFARLWSEVIPSPVDAQPEIRWGEVLVRRFDGCLFLLNTNVVEVQGYEYRIDLSKDLPYELSLPCGVLSIRKDVSRDGASFEIGTTLLSIPKDDALCRIKSRVGGESMYLSSATQKTALKKLYQSEKVLPWLRAQLPLIFLGDQLVYSAAGYVAQKCAASVSGSTTHSASSEPAGYGELSLVVSFKSS